MTTVVEGVDYGPLAQLIGRWVGSRGLDVAPDNRANPDKTVYQDEMVFTPAGPVDNAEEQDLVAVKYHHIVKKASSGAIFHDQIGHWIYEPFTGKVMHSLSIPRGVCVLAGGNIASEDSKTIFTVKAVVGSENYGIVQSPFMMQKAKTNAFDMKMTVSENELHYREVTSLFIYGKDFEHVDESTLQRVKYEGAN